MPADVSKWEEVKVRYQEPNPSNKPQPDWSRRLRLWYEPLLDGTSADPSTLGQRRPVENYHNANLISSESKDAVGIHLPLIDLDMPCVLIDSSTPGHHHLVIQKPLTSSEYGHLLKALYDVGLLQKGVFDRWLREGRTYIRRPGDKKPS